MSVAFWLGILKSGMVILPRSGSEKLALVSFPKMICPPMLVLFTYEISPSIPPTEMKEPLM